MVIFPALICAERDFGSPRALRWRRVRGFSGSGGGVLNAGGVLGSGDEAADDERVDSAGEPGAERSGVEPPISSTRLKGVREGDRRELLVRFAVPSDADDPDDSSKERFGDR